MRLSSTEAKVLDVDEGMSANTLSDVSSFNGSFGLKWDQ